MVHSTPPEHTATSAAGSEAGGHRLSHGSAPPTKENAADDTATLAQEKPFSIFTKREKWIIVALMSFGCLFSPLTANIYFPAIPTIAAAFHKSTELINLTVTVYMILQGVAPMVWGTMADITGRRPIFLACLLILCLSCVGLALMPTSDYWLLVLLRCIQAAGSASTVALAAGVTGDIATPEERGGFFGIAGVGALLGPAIGPVIGGALTQSMGWRSIFWFLCIASGLCALLLFLIMPETLRSIVGDGSITPPLFYRVPIPFLGRATKHSIPSERAPRKKQQNPFAILFFPDVATLLVFNGIIYAVFYAVLTPMSTSFALAYPSLTETEIGLCFLATGGGMIIGTAASGKLLDYQYKRVRDALVLRAEDDKQSDAADLIKEENFPFEWTRLQSAPLYLALFTVAVFGYGWSIQSRTSIAVPLILQIIVGYTVVGIMNTSQTLLLDLVPDRGSSVTAANNFVRCSLGAAMTAVIDLIISAVGEGWTYVIMGGICVVVSPLVLVEVRMGATWRAQRRAREQKRMEMVNSA